MAKKAGRKRDGHGANGGGISTSEHANKSKKVKSSEKSTSAVGDDGFNRRHGGAPFTTLKNSDVGSKSGTTTSRDFLAGINKNHNNNNNNNSNNNHNHKENVKGSSNNNNSKNNNNDNNDDNSNKQVNKSNVQQPRSVSVSVVTANTKHSSNDTASSLTHEDHENAQLGQLGNNKSGGSVTDNRSKQDKYTKWLMDQDGMIQVDQLKRQVQTYVRETLFTKVKFITDDSELEYVGKQHLCGDLSLSLANFNRALCSMLSNARYKMHRPYCLPGTQY